ncbi:MAG: hypothetical protein RMK29_09540 [Myxococcales bacterium]|nr:hypothetical protein [Myxococcota bacterium]MDW8281943.1 hypothetical protein [Myxococcales bacterium]
MTRLYIRAVLYPIVLVGMGGLGLGGCPKPAPPPQPVVQPPPPPPRGDLFRFSQQAGTSGQGRVSIRIENEPLNPKPGRKGASSGRLMRAYTLTEEHLIVSVDADGTQHITGKLIDVEGKTDNPKEQREADALARALSEIKISFDRTARGEVIPAKLEITDVNRPLDPRTARIVAGSIYGAGRGPIFPEEHVEVGRTWTIRSEVPIPGGNITWEIEYKYERREGNIAVISFSGKSSGESQGAQLTGDAKGELRFDLQKGALAAMTVDTKNASDPGPQASTPGTILRVHVEWEAVAPQQEAAQ